MLVAYLRATLRALAFVGWMLVILPFVLILWALRANFLRAPLVQLFYRVAARICGLRVKAVGDISSERPLLLVANHASYLDIFVIGSLLPISFTPKKEVRGWPVIGFLCVLADCVFVERRPSEMQTAAAEMKKRVLKGRVLCLFPEGTTNDGTHVKAFKSGFLSLAEAYHLPVQPVTIAYTHIGRELLLPARREEVSWVGEATFFDHFWHVLSLPSLRVEVLVHPVQLIDEHGGRKALTQSCERVIATGLAEMLEKTHAG